MYCGCPAGTHGCDLVSRVRLDQSANLFVWLGLVSHVREVIVETWNMRKSKQPSSTRIVVTSWSTLGSSFQPNFNTAILIRSHNFCCSTPSRACQQPTRTGPVESLARSDLVPSSSLPLRAMDIKLAGRASTSNYLTVMAGHQLLCSDPVTFHLSLLCFGAFDLHLLDESDRCLRRRVSHSFSLHQPRG